MPGTRDESFPAECRLRNSNDFRRAFRRGQRRATAGFVLYVMPNRLEVTRLGIQVRRKIGTAVSRNRIKRMVRETFRKMKQEFRQPLDLVLVAEKTLSDTKSGEFETMFRAALEGLLK